MDRPVRTAETATVISSYALAIAKALESCGADPQQVFRAAGVDIGGGSDPLRRLSHAAVNRLYSACVDATGDHCFGLTVARFIQPSTMHALGHGLLASSTLMDFALRLQRYFAFLSQRARVDVSPQGSGVRLEFRLLFDVAPQSQDAWLGAMFLTMRTLYRDDFRPLEVEFAHAMPRGTERRYVEFFGAPVRFDRDVTALVLRRPDMEAKLDGASPELAQWHDQLAATYIAKLDRADVVANVRARILELLPSGACSKGKVARDLAMSATTLHQRLNERGTSFHALLNDIRQELAMGYLHRSATPVTEIAFVLGFTDVSNFTRAFKRWTGVSPTRYREQERAVGSTF